MRQRVWRVDRFDNSCGHALEGWESINSDKYKPRLEEGGGVGGRRMGRKLTRPVTCFRLTYRTGK